GGIHPVAHATLLGLAPRHLARRVADGTRDRRVPIADQRRPAHQDPAVGALARSGNAVLDLAQYLLWRVSRERPTFHAGRALGRIRRYPAPALHRGSGPGAGPG